VRIRPYDLTPQSMLALWMKLRERQRQLIAGDGDPENVLNFAEYMTADSTAVFEVGDFGGVVIFTDIGNHNGEVTAHPHIFIWGRECFGKWRELREFAIRFMSEFGVYRLIAESPTSAGLEHRLVERIGFTRIGIIRGRRCVNGKVLDFYLYDFLPSDSEELRRTA